MASRAEEFASRSLRTILAGLPAGASIDGSEEFQRALDGLEFFLPAVPREVYPEWERESLDGFYPLFARKAGEREIELFGFCILISDQTLTPIHLRLLSPTSDEVSWLELQLGESGANGMVRLPYPTEGMIDKQLHALNKRAVTIAWVYQATFGKRSE
jgi:hypothetical protein